MDVNQVKELSDLFEKKGLSKMEICEGDTKVIFEKEREIVEVTSSARETSPAPLERTASPAANEHTAHFTEVKSPMVGVFYAASTPDSEPFVSVGSKVRKGDVLCIVEAMKLMNEIVAETDGEIADICVENGQIVEFSQVLFKIF